MLNFRTSHVSIYRLVVVEGGRVKHHISNTIVTAGIQFCSRVIANPPHLVGDSLPAQLLEFSRRTSTREIGTIRSTSAHGDYDLS
jgi:hypothetical protein